MPDSIHYDSAFHRALNTEDKYTSANFAEAERIELFDDTDKNEIRSLGYCTFNFFKEPFPFYYVIYVERTNYPKEELKKQGSQGKTVGDLIMEKVNQFMRDKNCPAVLNNILDDDSKAHELYLRNGWKSIKQGSSMMILNLHRDLTEEEFVKIDKTAAEGY